MTKASPSKEFFEELEKLNVEFVNTFPLSSDDMLSSEWANVSYAILWQLQQLRFYDTELGQQDGGLMTLPRELVETMIQLGFGWGGHYRTSRDFMHFDYPPVS